MIRKAWILVWLSIVTLLGCLVMSTCGADHLLISPVKPLTAAMPTTSLQVELLMFGAEWCEPCKQMTPIIRRMRERGYKIFHARVDKPKWDQLTKAHRADKHALPFFVIGVDGRAWKIWEGRTSERKLIERWQEAENEWRRRHGKPPRQYQPIVVPTEEDQEYLEENHWRLTPGTCGMLGCVAHGGGWMLEKGSSYSGDTCPSGRCPR